MQAQYNNLVTGLRGLDDIAKYKKYRLLRPQKPINENPYAWWLYASRCHGYLRYQKNSNLAKNNLRYLSICKRIIANPNEAFSTEEKDFKEQVEKERTLEELRGLREICMYLIPQSTKLNTTNSNNPSQGVLVHWFPQWMGWYGSSASTEKSPSQIQSPIVEAQSSFEDEFLNALADTVDTNSILKRDAVFGKFDFILKKGTLDVFGGGFENPQALKIQFQFENLLLGVESRPRSGSHFVSLSVGSVLLKDHITPGTEFPDVIKPQVKDDSFVQAKKVQRSRLSLGLMGATSPPPQNNQNNEEPLFQLEYERKPLSINSDYRLLIKSRSLDIVYNVGVIKWFVDFISKPHQLGARRKIEAMKHKTKMELKKNWDSMIEGHLSERKTWTLEIDISAPQIIFVENFSDRSGTSIVVIDFGRLQMSNITNGKTVPTQQKEEQEISVKDSEDDDLFLTPCSTPPQSQVSTNDSPTLISALSDLPSIGPSIAVQEDQLQLNEGALLDKLYDRYNINLTDLQILVCKGKERWNFASSKGTSNMHVLDRFNISLQLERRVVHTTDPQYPSLTLNGTLPKLNVHVNELKIGSMLNVLNIYGQDSFRSPQDSPLVENVTIESSDGESNYRDSAKLILLQFSIDQMSLEVQSCGRSIAELQVTGVKAGYSQRSADTSITLSVHGLLLVDAIQSYGPDFELLVASHRHVGMDSLSGSLRQSEPCSPCSPGSPDPSVNVRPTSPLSISRAISSLQRGELISV